MFVRPDQVNSPLYVICPIFNPIRYRSRWKLFCDFQKMVKDAGAKLITVEVAFGNRDFALDKIEHENYIQLRTTNELWLKENLINIGFSRLPYNWEYAAWIDGDIVFSRSDWANETIQQLQHYAIVQMFAQSQDLTPDYEVLRTFRGYAWCVHNKVPRKGLNEVPNDYTVAEYYHSGYAWAIRREAYNQLGGLIDWAILGGADLFMANALFDLQGKLPQSLGVNGIRQLQLWKERADRYIKKNVGYVPGLILHFWHGKKTDRKYQDRGMILTNAKFNPQSDLIRDWQGLWQLNPQNVALRDGIREYFRSRNEDSIDL